MGGAVARDIGIIAPRRQGRADVRAAFPRGNARRSVRPDRPSAPLPASPCAGCSSCTLRCLGASCAVPAPSRRSRRCDPRPPPPRAMPMSTRFTPLGRGHRWGERGTWPGRAGRGCEGVGATWTARAGPPHTSFTTNIASTRCTQSSPPCERHDDPSIGVNPYVRGYFGHLGLSTRCTRSGAWTARMIARYRPRASHRP